MRPHFLLLVGLVAAVVRLTAPCAWAQAVFGPATTSAVGTRLSPEAREFAEQIYRDLSPGSSPAAIGNVAVSLWMIGRLEVALHLMGKAVGADPANTDNQNNYAAMLTMSGGAKQAIPVLEGLAKKFPENPTVLNNLGQAYYHADDKEKAEKVLDRALAVAPRHAQAAATQSEIAESKGNAAKAVALAQQAIQQSVSRDKLNRLRKLGHKLTLEDLKDARPADPDPLGLRSFVPPPFPRNAIEENRTRREWASFYNEVQARREALQKKLHQLQPPALAHAQAQAAYAQFLSGKKNPGAAKKAGEPVRPFAQKARLMLDLLNRDAGARLRLKHAKEALDALLAKDRQLVETEYRAEYNKLERKDANQAGEGLANASFCDQFVALADKYLARWNDGREAFYNEYLHQLRLKLSEEIYWQQLLQPRKEFEATVVKAQLEWLAAFAPSGIRTDGTMGIQVDDSCLRQKQEPRGGKLAHFNDVHCRYHSELNLGIGSIVTDCDRMVSTLGAGPVKLGLTQDMAQGTDFYDSFVSCSVEISAGKGAKVGPVSLDAEAGVGVEIGRDGVQDVYVTGKIEASVINAAGSGAEARMSLISGSASTNML